MGSCCHSIKVETNNADFDSNEKNSMLHDYPVGEGNSPRMNGTQHIISDSDDTASDLQTKNSNRKKSNTKHYKILLLGPGMSGKTTLYKVCHNICCT